GGAGRWRGDDPWQPGRGLRGVRGRRGRCRDGIGPAAAGHRGEVAGGRRGPVPGDGDMAVAGGAGAGRGGACRGGLHGFDEIRNGARYDEDDGVILEGMMLEPSGGESGGGGLTAYIVH